MYTLQPQTSGPSMISMSRKNLMNKTPKSMVCLCIKPPLFLHPEMKSCTDNPLHKLPKWNIVCVVSSQHKYNCSMKASKVCSPSLNTKEHTRKIREKVVDKFDLEIIKQHPKIWISPTALFSL